MRLLYIELLSLLFCSVFCYQIKTRDGDALYAQTLELEWTGKEEPDREAKGAPAPKLKSWTSSSEVKKYPEYVIVSNQQKELFKPERGVRPLPPFAKKILLDPEVTPIPAGGSDPSKKIDVLCHIDRMYVRVRKDMFRTPDAFKFLRLGSCPVNAGKKDHFFLLYPLNSQCGFQRMSNRDCVLVSIVLSFNPTTPILRDLPFEVKLQCRFPRFFHSYKVGFSPELRGGTVYRQLQSRTTFALTPQDEFGNNIMGPRTFTLGQPMFFQASGPSSMTSAGNMRLYIQNCHMTVSQNPNTTPRYTVIENQGCMIESKITPASRFIKGDQKRTQKFQVAAFIFRDQVSSASTQQLFMHCQISLGPLTPTPSLKACNFDPATKKWKELHGLDWVCDCCESTCPSPHPRTTSTAVISTRSLKVGTSGEDVVEVDPLKESSEAEPLLEESADETDQGAFLSSWGLDAERGILK